MKNTKIFIIFILASAILISVPSAWAMDNKVATLTLEESISRAFNYSNELKKIINEIKINEKYRDDASFLLQYTPINRNFTPGDENTFNYFYSSDFKYREAQKRLENEKKQLIIDVYKAYFDVLTKQMEVKAYKDEFNKAKVEVNQANAKYEMGMTTVLELLKAQANVKEAEANLEEKQKELDSAYSEFNSLVGLSIDDRPNLVDDIDYNNVNLINIEGLVALALDNSYEIWTVEEAVELAKITKLFAKWYDEGEWEQKNAELDAANAKDNMKKNIRQLCLGIKVLEEKREGLLKTIEQVEEAYRIAKINYEVGTVTLDKVLDVKVSLEKLKAALTEVEALHQVSVMTLDKYTNSKLIETPLDKEHNKL